MDTRIWCVLVTPNLKFLKLRQCLRLIWLTVKWQLSTESNPCLHGGACIPNCNNYTCNCVVGSYGTHCEFQVSLSSSRFHISLRRNSKSACANKFIIIELITFLNIQLIRRIRSNLIYPWAVDCEGPPSFILKGRGGGGRGKKKVRNTFIPVYIHIHIQTQTLQSNNSKTGQDREKVSMEVK